MKYLYQTDNNLQYIYYITPKCATRTFFSVFNYNSVGLPRQTSSNYDDYFSWSFVRNPWDRLVSTYINKIVDRHQHGLDSWRKNFKSFKEFILKIEKTDITDCDRHIRSLYTFFPQNINFIGKFENLQEDFNTVCDKIGIPRQQLPHKNATKHKHYTEYYDDETRDIVAEKYAKDIEHFGYKFGE
tara:strand:+ start:811 stop:1365 length:555 start_codon:yes stop_codon:yes gene_type:complete